METKRRTFQGAINILSFNRHFYIYGIGTLTATIISQILMDWPVNLLWLIIIFFAYGLLIPLVISAYVYDYSNYYALDWLDKEMSSESRQLVSINAGFDETSYIIQEKYPNASLKVFDFYDPKLHTEPAIVRARKASLVFPNTQAIQTQFIPLEDKSTDVVFLLSSAHEIRSSRERIQFLRECHRVCKPDGKVIMIEHLRDLPNFFAFTVGFTHFHSRKAWYKAFIEAGFLTMEESKFTPFMSIFKATP